MKSACISCMILTMALCSPPFPRFLGQKWKLRRASLGLFRIQLCAPPPAGGFSEFILIAEKFPLKIKTSMNDGRKAYE